MPEHLKFQPWAEDPECLKLLAERLAPFMAPAVAPMEVRIKRMHRTSGSGKTVAFVDLTFCANGTELATVNGFKLLRNPDDQSVWLGVPQRKDDRGAEGAKWIDTFKFENNALEKMARRVVVDEFKKQEGGTDGFA